MSPEGLIDNIYGPKTDVWAFGVFLYEVLHGDTPLGFCKTEAELKTHITTPLPIDRIKHSLPPDLKDLILKCL
jgi:serine/threonine protein kinase